MINNRGPSERALAAAGQILTLLEGLTPQDRGYVANRVSNYLCGKPVKEVKKALAGKVPAGDKKSATSTVKQSWKAEWEATPEYQAWQAYIAAHRDDSDVQRAVGRADFESVRQSAFRVRDQIKARGGDSAGGGSASASESKSTPEDDFENEVDLQANADAKRNA